MILARQADLSDAYLSTARMNDVKLPYALPRRTNMRSIEMHRADLANADMSNADGYQADLFEATLTNAILFEASLEDADLTNTNLTGANLMYTNLTDVIWSNTICPYGSNSDTNGLNACAVLP